jgi:hypothetical protein
MGMVYLVLGAMTLYYGEKVSLILSLQSMSKYSTPNPMNFKLRTVSLSIGGLFLLKSLCGMLTALNAFDDFYPVCIGANVWDFLV